MRDVRAVVDAQADGDDEVDAGDGVDGQAPEVHETTYLDKWQDDHEQDEQWWYQVT